MLLLLEMDQPLCHPSNSHIMLHNLLLSMPYQSQESLSLTAGHVQPYLTLEEQQCYKNNFGATSAKGNPIIFTAVMDSQHTNYNTNKDKVEIAGMDNIQHDRILVESAHLLTRKNFPFISDHHIHSGHWTPCCTAYCPCPEHHHSNMGSSCGSQELQATAELQRMVHSLMDGQNIHQKHLGGERIFLWETSSYNFVFLHSTVLIVVLTFKMGL
ncbi:hypothetical protein SUGI_0740800 [Cryptomeria japonica]|nr:hypothetical protein SUGI_0740800 [Cryptomeria japonica]